MPSVHAMIVRVSAKHFAALVRHVKEDTYSPKKREGFLTVEDNPTRFRGKYFFPKKQKVKYIDPESLEPQVEEHTVLGSCGFTILPAKGLVWVHGGRSDLKVIEAALSQYMHVSIEFERINADVVEVYRELEGTQDKMSPRAIKIQNFTSKDGMTATANFTLEHGREDEAVGKHAQDIRAVTCQTMTDEGRQTLKFTNKASVTFSKGIGDDLVEVVLGLLIQHHEEVELEDVEPGTKATIKAGDGPELPLTQANVNKVVGEILSPAAKKAMSKLQDTVNKTGVSITTFLPDGKTDTVKPEGKRGPKPAA